MTIAISSGIDVVNFLHDQHAQIKSAFKQVLATSGEDRKNLFLALRRLLAVHETAEEEVVHPVARRALTDGEMVVRARLEEEHHAKQILTRLEGLEGDSLEFEQELVTLQSSVVLHARAEEVNEFQRLGDVLERDQLERMRNAVQLAERLAPTRPHAGVESAALNLLVGPFAAMLDRARDLISGKS